MIKDYYAELKKDVRFIEGLNACISCGTCTAICPAAEFYNYDPRLIVETLQRNDNEEVELLLKSNTIWYCGECLSCKTRCPRNNTPGFLIQALRHLSHQTGFFVESEKGRQSLALKRTVGEEIIRSGYCMFIDNIHEDMHPEQGPVWTWMREHTKEVYEKCGANYKGEGSGAMRKISDEALIELKNIFEVSGGKEFFDNIEKFSERKAKELGLRFDETNECEYFRYVYKTNNQTHGI